MRGAALGPTSGNNNVNDDDGSVKNGKRDKNGKVKGDKHAGHNHGDAKSKSKADRADKEVNYLEICRPIQPVRVAGACETAREAGVSIVSVNLSGEDGPATGIMDACVNGLIARDMNPTNKRMAQMSLVAASDDAPPPSRTTPSGLSLNVSADGTSFAGDVSNMEELREMLASVLPSGEVTRKVRLVN